MKRLRVVGLMLGILALVLLSGYRGAKVAEAQSFAVTLELSSPANGTSARILQATYKNGGGATVGQFGGTLLVFGTATSSATTAVTDIPDSAEVTFRVPYNGVTTTIVVDSADFGSPILLPNPSPGGTVFPGGGDPAIDPSIVVSVAEVSGDNVAPTCVSSQPTPDTIEFTVQDPATDPDSGLDEIIVSEDRNADVFVPAFTPGTTAPVIVTATILDTSRTATVLLKVIDQAGNRTYCKRSVRRQWRTRSRSYFFSR